MHKLWGLNVQHGDYSWWYLTCAKWVDLKCSQLKKEMVILWVIEALTNAAVITVLQSISVKNEYVVYFKLIQRYISIFQ